MNDLFCQDSECDGLKFIKESSDYFVKIEGEDDSVCLDYDNLILSLIDKNGVNYKDEIIGMNSGILRARSFLCNKLLKGSEHYGQYSKKH